MDLPDPGRPRLEPVLALRRGQRPAAVPGPTRGTAAAWPCSATTWTCRAARSRLHPGRGTGHPGAAAQRALPGAGADDRPSAWSPCSPWNALRSPTGRTWRRPGSAGPCSAGAWPCCRSGPYAECSGATSSTTSSALLFISPRAVGGGRPRAAAGSGCAWPWRSTLALGRGLLGAAAGAARAAGTNWRSPKPGAALGLVAVVVGADVAAVRDRRLADPAQPSPPSPSRTRRTSSCARSASPPTRARRARDRKRTPIRVRLRSLGGLALAAALAGRAAARRVRAADPGAGRLSVLLPQAWCSARWSGTLQVAKRPDSIGTAAGRGGVLQFVPPWPGCRAQLQGQVKLGAMIVDRRSPCC